MVKPKLNNPLPELAESDIALLEKLSNACGVSGNEKEIRKIIKAEITALADELQTDVLGNLIAIKKSKAQKPIRVLIAAHMDEVGFMLADKDGDGLFRFVTVGGIDDRSLAGKPVLVGEKQLPGVMGACPVHLSTRSEREVILKTSALRIDTGPDSKDPDVGDYAAFATRFQTSGPSLMGKALDNRIGVATLIRLFKDVPEHIELIAAFTVQEEIGLRGAKTAAYNSEADIAFILDCTPANDQKAFDGSENTNYRTRVGHGPAIYTMDGRTLYDHRLIRYLADLGDQYGIRYQYRQPAPGGTDAGAIHLTKGGIPSISISVPGRYPHTACMVARKADWEGLIQLMTAALRHLNLEILAGDR